MIDTTDLMLIASAGELPASTIKALRRADRVRKRTLKAEQRYMLAAFSSASRAEYWRASRWYLAWLRAETRAFGGQC